MRVLCEESGVDDRCGVSMQANVITHRVMMRFHPPPDPILARRLASKAMSSSLMTAGASASMSSEEESEVGGHVIAACDGSGCTM